MEKIGALKNHFFTIVSISLLTVLVGTIQSAEGEGHKLTPLETREGRMSKKKGRFLTGLTAVPFTDVRISDGFWAPRIETNRKVTIPYAFGKCEETGRINNFAKAGGLMKGKFEGIYFNDSDVYKVIEGAAYSLKKHPDAKLEEYVDKVIDKIAASQWEDGYLYTFYSVPQRQPEKRWTNVQNNHELYCAGHFFEAAVAYYQATGKRKVLDVAIRLADYIDSVFGPDKKRNPPGHEEIEIGLVKLYRVTGEEKYLKLAKFFLDERGRADGHRLYGHHFQDHQPVIEQSEAVGHSVRATYMYCGMADVAALSADAAYMKAIERIWENVVSKKLYITGGIGSRGGGEAFGDSYELPNMSAYCESCAAIGNALWNYRMFLLHGEAKYIDVMERTLYNGLISGVSLAGNRFFYPNPLESYGQHSRSPWFGCACCPSNITRFIPSVPGYVYAHGKDIIYVNLFVGGSGTIKMGGNSVQIEQETRYPWYGAVKMTVNPEHSAEFAICIRIPGWAQNKPVPSDLYRYMNRFEEEVTLKVNGRQIALDMEKGFARIRRKWKKGDVIDLALAMPIRRVVCNEKVKENAGRAALERGPIVYCAEWPDNEDGHVLNLLLPDRAELRAEYRKDMLNGIVTISGKALGLSRGKDGKSIAKKEQNFVAIPYYAWAHRGAGEMSVWLARNMSAARPLPAPTIASTSKVSASDGSGAIEALNDQWKPKNSNDHSNRHFHWWPHKGTREWAQYDFRKPERICSVEVYWFDDTGMGECRVPRSWRLMYKDGEPRPSEGLGEQWKEVANPSGYGVEKDKYNKVTFEPVEASALRMEIQLQKKFSAGILEWRVE